MTSAYLRQRAVCFSCVQHSCLAYEAFNTLAHVHSYSFASTLSLAQTQLYSLVYLTSLPKHERQASCFSISFPKTSTDLNYPCSHSPRLLKFGLQLTFQPIVDFSY